MKLLSGAALVNVEKDWKWCHYTANKTTLSSLVEYIPFRLVGEASD